MNDKFRIATEVSKVASDLQKKAMKVQYSDPDLYAALMPIVTAAWDKASELTHAATPDDGTDPFAGLQ